MRISRSCMACINEVCIQRGVTLYTIPAGNSQVVGGTAFEGTITYRVGMAVRAGSHSTGTMDISHYIRSAGRIVTVCTLC